MSTDSFIRTCPFCGEEFVHEQGHTCEELPPIARRDECPMCGQTYADYLHHISTECDGG